MQSGQNLHFAQTGKENTRMSMKSVIYFEYDEKVMQKLRVINFNHKDHQTTCSRPSDTNNQILTYVH